MQRTVRALAFVAALLYGAAATMLLSLIAGEEDGDFLFALALIVPPLLGAAVFLYGTVEWIGARNHVLRVLGWVAMLPGAVILVSFSFVVWPALLLMAPSLFLRPAGQASGGRQGVTTAPPS